LCPDRLGLPLQRVDQWVRTGIHVKGKRNWVFIKTHTHGSVDAPLVDGQPMSDAFSHMERNYNDGSRYVLHYLTAREVYNIIKAIEAGEPGEDPNQYRNYHVLPPKYDTSRNESEASERLRELVASTYGS
jgi:hypothetical protein